MEAGRFSTTAGFDSTVAYALVAVGILELLLERVVLDPEAEAKVSEKSAADSFSSVCQGSPEHREST